jgi:hypothetical protein
MSVLSVFGEIPTKTGIMSRIQWTFNKYSFMTIMMIPHRAIESDFQKSSAIL